MMNKVQNMNRGGYITSISGMKVVALWMIFRKRQIARLG